MTNSNLATISIGMTATGGSAGMLDIKFHQKITTNQAHELMGVAQTRILECFQQTKMIDLNMIITTFLAMYSDLSEISLDPNVVDLTKNEVNEIFQEWFGSADDVDIVFTIADCNYNFPSVRLANEGSSECFINLLREYDLCE